MTTARRKLGRPVDADSAETRQRIVVAARRIFATEGFSRTTNRQVAEAAGITPGAIYHYFDSKADLYVAVYDECQAIVYEAFLNASDEHDTFAAQLDAILDTAVRLHRGDPSLAAFWVASDAARSTHPEVGALIETRAAPPTPLVYELARQAAERGELPEGVEPWAVNDLMYVVLAGLTRLSTVVADGDRHVEVVRLLQQVLAAGLRGLAAPQRSRTTAAP